MVFSKKVKSLYEKYLEMSNKASKLVYAINHAQDEQKKSKIKSQYDEANKKLESFADEILGEKIYEEGFEKNPTLTNPSTGEKATWREIFKDKPYGKLDSLEKSRVIRIYENDWKFRL